jgi:hypothetical protein
MRVTCDFGLGEAREGGRPVRGERAAAFVVDGLGGAEKTISELQKR